VPGPPLPRLRGHHLATPPGLAAQLPAAPVLRPGLPGPRHAAPTVSCLHPLPPPQSPVPSLPTRQASDSRPGLPRRPDLGTAGGPAPMPAGWGPVAAHPGGVGLLDLLPGGLRGGLAGGGRAGRRPRHDSPHRNPLTPARCCARLSPSPSQRMQTRPSRRPIRRVVIARKRALRARGLTLRQLAAAAGCSWSMAYHWTNDRRRSRRLDDVFRRLTSGAP
jgi:hypothetical protein